MKRYGQYEGSTYVMEDNPEGEWVKHSKAEGIIKNLEDKVSLGCRAIIKQQRIINKLNEQNKEMLQALKEIYKDCTKHNTEKMRVLIQKVEGE